LITEDAGLTIPSWICWVKARRITITKDNTTIVAEATNRLSRLVVSRFVARWTRRILPTTKRSCKSVWQTGVAVVKVGAATETEMKDRKLRLKTPMRLRQLWKRYRSWWWAHPSPLGSSARVLGNQQSERRRVDRCDDCPRPGCPPADC